jgi:hypothetical protein
MLILFSLCFGKYNCEPKIAKYVQREDSDLIQVQIVSRHGARTPLHVGKGTDVWTCTNTEQASFKSGNETTPMKINVAFGRSVFFGNCYFGQLLGKGVKQLERTGKYFREIYIDKLKFLPTEYDPEVMRFRTTGALRTIHSQMAIANGLYPGNKSIVMEVADKNYDSWKRTSYVCPNFAKLLKAYPGKSEWLAEGLAEPDFTKNIEEQLGIKWSSVNDIMTSTLCQGYKLPPNITMDDVDKAISLRAKQHQFLYNHDKIFPLFFTFQAIEMLNEMYKRINGENKLRFIHWSAHDGNINSFLGYLGIINGVWPPYGTFFQVELHKFRKSKHYFIIFRYNGKILEIPRFSYSKVIPLKEFANFVKANTPSLYEECGFDLTKFMKQDTLPSVNY